MTIPGYPVFATHAKYYGGLVYNLPLREENGFLPDLGSIPAAVLRQAKVMVLNYPNNPTGASATPEFFAEAVAFAKEHRLVIIHDAAYAALVFEGRPLSFLATPGARDTGLELHSASKSLNMTGPALRLCRRQPAAGQGLRRREGHRRTPGSSWPSSTRPRADLTIPRSRRRFAAKDSRRMEALARVLGDAGFGARKPKGSFFLYASSESGGEERRRAPRVRQRRSGLAVAHCRAISFPPCRGTRPALTCAGA